MTSELEHPAKSSAGNTNCAATKAEKAEASAHAQLKPQLDEATSKLAHAKDRLSELAGSTGDAWEQLREGVHKSWDEMKIAFDKASHAFDEHSKKP